jgi:hypothetical protein
MAQARELRDRNDLTGALARFKGADAIMGVPTTGFEVARTQADLGMLVEARGTLRRVLATEPKDTDPEPFREARTKAEALDEELGGRIGALHFVVSGAAPGTLVSISVDGEAVPDAAAELPFRVDPGHHRVIAKAGSRRITREVDAGERDTTDIVLSFATTSDALPTSDHSSGASTRGIPTLAYVGGGVALGGIAVGSITGLMAISKKHAAQSGCVNGQCPPSTWGDVDRAHTLATVSTVGFIVGALGIAVGAGSFLFDEPSAPPKSAFVLSPGVSLHGGQMTLHGRF